MIAATAWLLGTYFAGCYTVYQLGEWARS